MKAKQLAYIKFTVAAIILGLMGFWIVKTSTPFNALAYGIIAVMLMVVGFVIYTGIQALKDAKSGVKPIDELSKRINEKAAAITFKISIYQWLLFLFATDYFNINSVNKAKLVIAIGMVVMTLTFIAVRIYLSKTGIDDN